MLVGLIVVAVALLQNYVTAPVAAPSASVRAATATPTPTARPAATIPTSVTPRVSTFALRISDADLTTAAGSSFPQTVSGVTLSDPDVRIESGSVRLTATAKVFFGTVPFVMTATPLVTDGRITVRLETATLAGVALPDSTRASITDTVQSIVSKLIPTSVRVTSITIAPGTLTVRGMQP